jgi:hypothetical protein
MSGAQDETPHAGVEVESWRPLGYDGLPYVIPERGQCVCPGSLFTPMRDGLCLCGMPRLAHVWEHMGAGAVRRVAP